MTRKFVKGSIKKKKKKKTTRSQRLGNKAKKKKKVCYEQMEWQGTLSDSGQLMKLKNEINHFK